MKFLLFIIVIFSITNLTAENVDQNTALQTAKMKLTYLGVNDEFSIVSTYDLFSDENLLAYIYDLSPIGYIVVSANNNISPIIAYSLNSISGVKVVEDNIFLQVLQSDLEIRNKNIINIPENILERRRVKWQTLLNANWDNDFQQWPSADSTWGGWLVTTWNQSPSPYYDFCPMDTVTDLRSIAGCPSIAMGQIVNYFKTINSTTFSDNDDYYHNYAGRRYWIDNDYVAIDFPSWTQLNEYLDTLSHHFLIDTLTNQDIAALIYSLGVAAHQVYTSSMSGTFGVSYAYGAFQKFSFNDAELIYPTDDSLFIKLAQDMKDAKPALWACLVTGGSGGHNMVADGFNSDSYYHINFGWGGSYDGWYLLPDDPSIPANLTTIEGVIVNISDPPSYVEEEISENQINNINLSISENFKSNTIISYSLPTTSSVNISVYNISGQLQEKLFNGIQSVGKHSIEFRTNSYTPGIYFINLSTEILSTSVKYNKIN